MQNLGKNLKKEKSNNLIFLQYNIKNIIQYNIKKVIASTENTKLNKINERNFFDKN